MTDEVLNRNDIIALEKSYWDAMKEKNGERTAQLAAKKSLVTGPMGMMTISRDKMGQMTKSSDWVLESYAFDDVEVSMPAPDIAIIAYTVRQKVKMKGQSQELRAADMSTWIRGTDGWECHAHSETFLKDEDAD